MTDEDRKKLVDFVATGLRNFLNGPMTGADIKVEGQGVEGQTLELKVLISPLVPVADISAMVSGVKTHEPESEDEFEARYLPDSVMYPSRMPWEFDSGTMYEYVSSTMLNGFINYGSVMSAWLINRYRSLDRPMPEWADPEEVEDNGPKRQLVDKWLADTRGHPNIGVLDDDVLILTKRKHSAHDTTEGKYAFFWFDCDVSDCCIGKFETNDPEADVIRRFRDYVTEKNKTVGQSYGKADDKGEVEAATELPASRFRGWISF